MNDIDRLRVYRESVNLTASVYRFTETLPTSEQWDLTRQLRRAAVSVPANIAEGAGRGDARDFARFVRIAIGSMSEIQSHLDVCVVCDLGDTSQVPELIAAIGRLRRQCYRLEQRLTLNPR